MMASEERQSAMERPFGARLERLLGEPTRAAGTLVTPIARRLAIWWPGGGWVALWPVAVEYPTSAGSRRARIAPVQTIALVALSLMSLVALVAFKAQRWMDAQAERRADR